MNTKRLFSMVMALCMVFLLALPAALSEGLLSGDLTNYLLFDMMFREATNASETIEAFHTFSPLYANGSWVRTYYSGSPTYMQVLSTSPGPQGTVITVNIISDDEESKELRELCGYAMAGLTLNLPGNIAELIDSGIALSELASEMDIESAGYTFSIEDDGTVPYASLKTVKPYDVEQKLDIPTNESVMYPLPAGAMSIKPFVENFEQALSDHYGIPSGSVSFIGASEEAENEWLHIYFAEGMALTIASEGGTDSADVKNVIILDIEGNPPLLVGFAMAAFGALAGFDGEQYAAMSLLSGAHTTFDDFQSFLPTIAYDNMMLLFGVSSELGTAYIMGVPGE